MGYKSTKIDVPFLLQIQIIMQHYFSLRENLDQYEFSSYLIIRENNFQLRTRFNQNRLRFYLNTIENGFQLSYRFNQNNFILRARSCEENGVELRGAFNRRHRFGLFINPSRNGINFRGFLNTRRFRMGVLFNSYNENSMWKVQSYFNQRCITIRYDRNQQRFGLDYNNNDRRSIQQ